MPGANFQTVRQDGVIGSNLTNILTFPVPTYTSATVTQNAAPSFNSTNPLNTGGPPGASQQGASTTIQTVQPNNPGGGLPSQRFNQPLNLLRNGFSNSLNAVTFSPVIEFRAKLNYQLFHGVSVSGGWTGLYADGMARAPYMVDYTLPSMGILASNNQQYVFVNGLSLGVEVNR